MVCRPGSWRPPQATRDPAWPRLYRSSLPTPMAGMAPRHRRQQHSACRAVASRGDDASPHHEPRRVTRFRVAALRDSPKGQKTATLVQFGNTDLPIPHFISMIDDVTDVSSSTFALEAEQPNATRAAGPVVRRLVRPGPVVSILPRQASREPAGGGDHRAHRTRPAPGTPRQMLARATGQHLIRGPPVFSSQAAMPKSASSTG